MSFCLTVCLPVVFTCCFSARSHSTRHSLDLEENTRERSFVRSAENLLSVRLTGRVMRRPLSHCYNLKRSRCGTRDGMGGEEVSSLSRSRFVQTEVDLNLFGSLASRLFRLFTFVSRRLVPTPPPAESHSEANA